MATILEHSKISPPADSAPEFTLPIIFFDMLWYEFPAPAAVLFFEFPCSKVDFLDTIVPDLKSSLSLTLGHFLPLAGNIIHPLTSEGKPMLRYEAGDSVCFVVSESSADFNHLTGNHPRVSDEFYAFVPNLPSATHSKNSVAFPVLSVQVTLFPGQGLCMGFVVHHAILDASTTLSFIKAWGIINRTKRDVGADDICARLKESNCLPFYDRTTVKNLNGLDSIYWDPNVYNTSPVEPPSMNFPINKVRATFVLKKDDIQNLKNLVLAKCPGGVARLSSFAISCALVWFCSAKSASLGGEEVADDEPEYFCFVADCRGRLSPPLPSNYFGNCVAPVKTEAKHGELKGPDGFVMAAKAIARAIQENVYGERGILYDAENWGEEYGKLIGKRQFGVAGSPRFDFYEADYGWGKAKKFEILSVDGNGSISLCKSRDFEGGLEIGLSKTKYHMDAFTTVFKEIISNLV